MQSTPTGGSAATILVVDDDALITLNTVDLVTELGHVALEAFSGAEALRLLEANPQVDLLITDFSMPNMNGLDLAHAAQKLRPGLPVLLATGYAELPGDGDASFPMLEKPFREQELAAKLGELLKPRAAE